MLSSNDLILIAPSVKTPGKSEAELFGAMVWLWMHSETHRPCPLSELERLLMPAVQTGQFVLALDRSSIQRPVGMMTWAWFSAETERRYLQSLDCTLRPQNWQEGDRPWILDWVAPFGQTKDLARQTRLLLNKACFRSLYHKGDHTGLRVLHFKGAEITPASEVAFWASRPLAIDRAHR